MWAFVWTSPIGEVERVAVFPTRERALGEVREMELAGGYTFPVDSFGETFALPFGGFVHIHETHIS